MKKTSRETLDLKRRLREATPEERASLMEGLPYAVGFGKPPKATRFQPGQSGNARGRPKGARNLSSIVREELEAPIEVTESGKVRKLSKFQVALRQQANKAATNDTKAFQVVVDLARKVGLLETAPAAEAPPIDKRDLAAAADLLRFFAGAGDPDDGENGGAQ